MTNGKEILFVIFGSLFVNGQELDVCNQGKCQWITPSNTKILVCIPPAIECYVYCNTPTLDAQCQDLIVYNLTPLLYVICDQTDSCKNIKVIDNISYIVFGGVYGVFI